MIPNGSKVGYSGSVSLEQTGVLDRLRKGDYVLYDRSKVAKGSREARRLEGWRSMLIFSFQGQMLYKRREDCEY
jgi:hypothetical protein